MSGKVRQVLLRALPAVNLLVGGALPALSSGKQTDEDLGRHVREVLAEHGGVAALSEQYQMVSAYHRKNQLPLLWPIHRSHRAVLFRLLDQLDIRSATQEG